MENHWWCGVCQHVYSERQWYRNSYVCPTKDCRAYMNSAQDWESILNKHPEYEVIPDPNQVYPR